MSKGKKIKPTSEIISSFYSNSPLENISKDLGLSRKPIRKIWVEHFGEDLVVEGSKPKKDIIKNTDKIIELFYSDFSIKKIEDILNTDQRKIRRVWREKFGEDAVKKRGIKLRVCSENPRKLGEEVLEKIRKMSGEKSHREIAELLNISSSFIQKYLITLPENDRKKIIRKTQRRMSDVMKEMREKDKISKKKKEEVGKYFNTDMFPHEIAKIVKLSRNSVANIFVEMFGEVKQKERIKRLEPKRIRKCINGLEAAGKFGSKPENLFYRTIDDRLNTKVIHHDLDILPPYEIDITIPELKIAIKWDGITHHKPIFGIKYYNKTKSRDKYKIRTLRKRGWYVFVVNDLCDKINEDFMNFQLDRLLFVVKHMGREDLINEQ